MQSLSNTGSLARRLEDVLARIRCAFPAAELGDVEGVEEGFPGATILFPNGVEVVVGVDIDLPQVFFEVVRTYVGRETVRFNFEYVSARGFASSSKLTASDVECLLGRYRQLEARDLTQCADAGSSIHGAMHAA